MSKPKRLSQIDFSGSARSDPPRFCMKACRSPTRTDAKLMQKAIVKLGAFARNTGIELR
ncbi:hypothetical protein [Fulvimarina sp. MAC3]|uniref:hypothetical protein n=1 Tax=Fulvimarina sp. MAC3 TaxID=3148887 RepID=UPI0031FCC237